MSPPSNIEQKYNDKYKFGKYYTPSDVIDMILGLCLKNGNNIILDPSCGTGAFLEHAYHRLSYLNKNKKGDFIKQIWGIDIDLDAINIAKNNLLNIVHNLNLNNINVLNNDFFDIKLKTNLQSTFVNSDINKYVPKVDCIVGNPPYTRQEELNIGQYGMNYKERIRNVISNDYPGINISNRAGIYAYFIIHASKFLKEDGAKLGFVTLRSWMDTKYGSDLQKFLLKYFKVLYIIEPETEKWFTDAQMLPCIIVVETCNNLDLKNNNSTKFIRLKNNLSSFWEQYNENDFEKWSKIDKFIYKIEKAQEIYNFNEINFLNKKIYLHESKSKRIVIIKQKYLKDDIKWGKFLTAPSIYFDILNKGINLFVPLSKIANIKRGITTGANNFFIFPNKNFNIQKINKYFEITNKKDKNMKFKIELEYIKPVIKSTRKHKSLKLNFNDGYIMILNTPKNKLITNKKHILKYINYGENFKIQKTRGLKRTNDYLIGYNNLKTTKNRKNWYSLPDYDPAPIIVPNLFWDKYRIFYNDINAQSTNAFFNVHPKQKNVSKMVCAYLNSTLFSLFLELNGRYIKNLDESTSNQIMVYELKNIPVLNTTLLKPYRDEIEKYFNNILNINFEEETKIQEIIMNMNKIDQIILNEILGLNDIEIKEVKKTIEKLINNRLHKKTLE